MFLASLVDKIPRMQQFQSVKQLSSARDSSLDGSSTTRTVGVNDVDNHAIGDVVDAAPFVARVLALAAFFASHIDESWYLAWVFFF